MLVIFVSTILFVMAKSQTSPPALCLRTDMDIFLTSGEPCIQCPPCRYFAHDRVIATSKDDASGSCPSSPAMVDCSSFISSPQTAAASERPMTTEAADSQDLYIAIGSVAGTMLLLVLMCFACSYSHKKALKENETDQKDPRSRVMTMKGKKMVSIRHSIYNAQRWSVAKMKRSKSSSVTEKETSIRDVVVEETDASIARTDDAWTKNTF